MAGDDETIYKANDSFVMPENNVTLTAQWTAKPVNYTVNYYWNGTEESLSDSKTGTELLNNTPFLPYRSS